jgi:hypothetical protein
LSVLWRRKKADTTKNQYLILETNVT